MRNTSILILTLGWLAGAFCWLHVVLSCPVGIATFYMLGLVPVFAYVASSSFGFYARDVAGSPSTLNVDAWALFGTSMVLSFLVTLCSFLLGHTISPDAWVPQTMQMLLSNVLFDGLTMMATLFILSAAVGPKRRFPILIAIILDVLVAAGFACASLWCGLMWTDEALSLGQVWAVLIARSPQGAGFELGRYFWAMHTTFLPTMFYLLVILTCWVGKLLVLPVARILRRGEVADQPHHLTGGTLLFYTIVFGMLATGIGYLQEGRKMVEQPPAAQSVSEVRP